MSAQRLEVSTVLRLPVGRDTTRPNRRPALAVCAEPENAQRAAAALGPVRPHAQARPGTVALVETGSTEEDLQASIERARQVERQALRAFAELIHRGDQRVEEAARKLAAYDAHLAGVKASLARMGYIFGSDGTNR